MVEKPKNQSKTLRTVKGSSRNAHNHRTETERKRRGGYKGGGKRKRGGLQGRSLRGGKITKKQKVKVDKTKKKEKKERQNRKVEKKTKTPKQRVGLFERGHRLKGNQTGHLKQELGGNLECPKPTEGKRGEQKREFWGGKKREEQKAQGREKR